MADTDATDGCRELEERLRRHVETLATTIGERHARRPQALDDARAYVEGELRAAGHDVAHQWYEVDGVRVANLEVVRPGGARAEEVLVVGAHYDSVPGSPGANDNASAVAALLELAGALGDLEPALTLRLVAFVNEEPPHFMTRNQGSLVYAKACRARGERIRLMVSLETIGCYDDRPGSQRYPPLFSLLYPDRGNFLGLVSDLRSRRHAVRFEQVFRRHCDVPFERTATFRLVPGVSWSDHWSFWRQGYRAFMLTDTAFYRYPYYHTALDTPDKLNFEALARVVRGLIPTFADLAREGP